MLVCHTCDNPLCCRNDDEGWYELNGVLHPRRGHLWIGTAADNTQDMIAKGRQATGLRESTIVVVPPGIAFGERHGISKLTDQDVREIRARHASEKISYKRLGKDYGIDQSTTYRIVHRKTWQHIP